jgi:hypothetical protein
MKKPTSLPDKTKVDDDRPATTVQDNGLEDVLTVAAAHRNQLVVNEVGELPQVP